jgi:predicted AlkP superfamily pyrophosphatase or phosphodiesterase
VSDAPQVRTVVVVSVDGLNPSAINELGRQGAPVLHRLIANGAATLNARTEQESTSTLPNHTGMVTGRRVDAAEGGHGITWNDERSEPDTVHEAAGERVSSVFSVVAKRTRTALFVGKKKLSLYQRSWPKAIDRFEVRGHVETLVELARADLRKARRGLWFLHLALPDEVGHAEGFMSEAYLDAVAGTDELLGRLVRTVKARPRLARHTVVVVTADHGGRGESHGDPTRLANYRVPFIVWGAGVADGANLYALNRDYARPGRRRTTYDAERQPVRNGDVANLVTDLLGLRSVPGSEHDADQDLDVR